MTEVKEPRLSIDEAKAVVATKIHPRVTEDYIKSCIADVSYLNDGQTTVCLLTLDNGFKVIGTSTPADPRNYDADVGQTYAYENAFKQLWPLLGFRLRDHIAGSHWKG